MKRQKTPQEKKANEYTKDHVVFSLPGGERPSHGFRHQWPEEKASANRAYRRTVKQALDASIADVDVESTPAKDPESITRFVVRKYPWSVKPLGEVVERNTWWRITEPVREFFLQSYDSSSHREAFASYLSLIVRRRTKQAGVLADFLDHFMGPEPVYQWHNRKYHVRGGHEWLRAFFRDEPEWEERVRAWIASFDK